MLMVWENELMVGVDEMDRDHYELIVRVNALFHSFNNGTSDEEIKRLMDFMSAYVITHFEREEALQLKYQYPYYKEHKAIHDRFRAEIEAQIQLMDQKGITSDFKMRMSRMTIDWLKEHLGGEDKRLARHILAVKSSETNTEPAVQRDEL